MNCGTSQSTSAFAPNSTGACWSTRPGLCWCGNRGRVVPQYAVPRSDLDVDEFDYLPRRPRWPSALSIMGLREIATFTTFHRVLNRNRWSPRNLACRLLHQLVETFVPKGPVVMAIDETIERRWGARIRARGIYQRCRSAPAMATASRPRACAGSASCCCWRRSPGPVACGRCRS